MGIALWIVPLPAAAEVLMEIMKPPIPLEPRPPKFYPHITLGSFSSSTPVADLKSSVPKLERPLHISFASLEQGDHFFRSVFIGIVKTDELVDIHAKVQAKLGIEAKSPRYPHLSLFYIPDEQTELRKEIVEELWRNGSAVQMDEGKIGFQVLNSREQTISTKPDGGPLCGFAAHEIWIVECDGPIEDWNVAEKVSLLD